MIEVAEHVYQLGSRYHNFFAIVEGGKATVIDAGCSKEFGSLKDGLAGLGLGIDAIELLVLTHAHGDHIGFANEAHGEGVPVKALDAEIPFANGSATGQAVRLGDLSWWKPGTARFLMALRKAGITSAPPVPGVEAFEDGDVLDVPGRLRVVGTPGHTSGHCVFMMEDDGIVFTGDALVTMHVLGGRPGPQMLPEVFHADYEGAQDSLDLIAALPADLTLSGHGEPWRGPIAATVQATKARLQAGR